MMITNETTNQKPKHQPETDFQSIKKKISQPDRTFKWLIRVN